MKKKKNPKKFSLHICYDNTLKERIHYNAYIKEIATRE